MFFARINCVMVDPGMDTTFCSIATSNPGSLKSTPAQASPAIRCAGRCLALCVSAHTLLQVSDEQLKLGLLEDVMDVIDLEGRRQGDEERVGGFDLIYLNGPVQVDRQGNYVCYLGCHNNRVRNRRKMLRKAAVTAQTSS